MISFSPTQEEIQANLHFVCSLKKPFIDDFCSFMAKVVPEKIIYQDGAMTYVYSKEVQSLIDKHNEHMKAIDDMYLIHEVQNDNNRRRDKKCFYLKRIEN